MANKWRLEGDLEGKLDGLNARNKAAIVAGANYIAPQAETYMRQNAKWTDQTGNARNGLKAKVVIRRDTVAVVCYHSVPYGIWLEVRWGGKYAIIRPAVQAMAPKFVEAVGKLMFR